MKKFINEKTVSDLRTDITKLGYSEKSGELSSGGELQSNFVDILSYLLNEWKKLNPENANEFSQFEKLFNDSSSLKDIIQ
jgi:hypothetical protein